MNRGGEQAAVHEGISFLLQRCAQCAGPRGGATAVYTPHGPDSPRLSGAFSPALQEYRDRYGHTPIGHILHELLSSHDRLCGDAGWLCCYLCCRLIEMGKTNCISNILRN